MTVRNDEDEPIPIHFSLTDPGLRHSFRPIYPKNQPPMRQLVIFAFMLSLTAGLVAAQDATVPQAQERSAGTYYKLFTLEFKPGKTDDALGILFEYLVPAWRAAGVEVRVIEALLQTRDVMLLIELEDGPGALRFAVPEQDARAWAALMERAGDPAAAEKAVDRFIGYVARQSESLVFIRDE